MERDTGQAESGGWRMDQRKNGLGLVLRLMGRAGVCVCLCVVLKERESRQGSTAAYLYRAWARVGSSIRLYVYGL